MAPPRVSCAATAASAGSSATATSAAPPSWSSPRGRGTRVIVRVHALYLSHRIQHQRQPVLTQPCTPGCTAGILLCGLLLIPRVSPPPPSGTDSSCLPLSSSASRLLALQYLIESIYLKSTLRTHTCARARVEDSRGGWILAESNARAHNASTARALTQSLARQHRSRRQEDEDVQRPGELLAVHRRNRRAYQRGRRALPL
jgi:hypothetical protein